jgi:ankyrin repeat protein
VELYSIDLDSREGLMNAMDCTIFLLLCLAVLFVCHAQFMTKREYEKAKKTAEKPTANPLAEIEAELKLEGYATYKNAEYANERREDGLTKLMVAANRPDQGKAKHLLAQGADAELTDARGDTALIMAVSKGYYYPAVEILKGHANIHHKNQKGINALHAAIAGGQLVLVETILSFDSAWRKSVDWSVAYNKKPKLVEEPISTGLTPLMMCAQGGEIKMAEKLIIYGADVNNQKAGSSETALMYAAIVGNIAMVSMLLENGADPYPHNDMGFTALIMAAHRGHDEVVKLFIDMVDASPHHHIHFLEQRDFAGYSALDHAIEEREQGAIDLLMAAGAEIGSIHPKISADTRQRRERALLRKRAVMEGRVTEIGKSDEDEYEEEEDEDENESEDEDERESNELK